MHDQADQLRKLVRQVVATRPQLAPGAPVVVVSGGQPGMGATTLACQLAREFARLGSNVVVVDADLINPTIGPDLFAAGRLAAVGEGRPVRRNGGDHPSLADVLSGKRRAAEVLAAASPGIHLLPGAGIGDAPSLDSESLARLRGELAALGQVDGPSAAAGRQCDIIVVDAGSGMSPWIDRIWQMAHQILLVTTCDDSAVLEAYAAVKLAQYHLLEQRLQLVTNRIDCEADAAAAAVRFAQTCRRFLQFDPKPSAALPAFASGVPTAASDEAFKRAVRLLAADLTCELRLNSLQASADRNAGSAASNRIANVPSRKG